MGQGIFSERKILKHLPSVTEYLAKREYPPIQVEIDITNHCTSDCPFCFGYENRKLKDFILFEGNKEDDLKTRYNRSIQKTRQLIDDLATAGVKALTFTGGGDPTTHKGLMEFLELSHSRGMQNGLITNGFIDVGIEALRYCTWIRFSVDAATEETYEKQHGRRSHFKKVIENIKGVSAVKRRLHYGTTIGVGFLTNAASRHEIVNFARLWKECLGIDYIQYRPTLDTFGEHWMTDTDKTIELIREAKKIDPRVVWSEAKYRALENGEQGFTKRCYGTFFEVAIGADGYVYVCCHMKGILDDSGKPRYAIGNLNKESFFQVWKRHLRTREFRMTRDCPSYCRHYGTNRFFEDEILAHRQHENFI